MLVVAPKIGVAIRAATPSRILLLGGEPMDGPRHIWWNFVSSSKQRIEQAKDDWRNRRFAIVAGDEKEFIPLPDGP
jgi:redox-sensitive bicupin YhaK (pirin superfamily)